MRFNHALPAFALLAGCAASSEEYPSLALRPAEVGAITPAPAPGPVPQPSPGTIQRVEHLAAEAAQAHRAFLAEAPAARSAIDAGRGGGEGSDSWARAQVALSELQATRNPASIALADIDRIYADAATGGTDVSRIAEVRARVATQVDEQDRTIAALSAGLD